MVQEGEELIAPLYRDFSRGIYCPGEKELQNRGGLTVDFKAMIFGGFGGAVFGFLISTYLTRDGCGAVACRINRSPKIATFYYAVIGASLGLTLHAF